MRTSSLQPSPSPSPFTPTPTPTPAPAPYLAKPNPFPQPFAGSAAQSSASAPLPPGIHSCCLGPRASGWAPHAPDLARRPRVLPGCRQQQGLQPLPPYRPYRSSCNYRPTAPTAPAAPPPLPPLLPLECHLSVPVQHCLQLLELKLAWSDSPLKPAGTMGLTAGKPGAHLAPARPCLALPRCLSFSTTAGAPCHRAIPTKGTGRGGDGCTQGSPPQQRPFTGWPQCHCGRCCS